MSTKIEKKETKLIAVSPNYLGSRPKLNFVHPKSKDSKQTQKSTVAMLLAMAKKPQVLEDYDFLDKKTTSVPLQIDELVSGPKAMARSTGMTWQGNLFASCILYTNSSTGKYGLYFSGGQTWNINNVGNAAEFASLDAVFDEFFVHYMNVHFRPINAVAGALLNTTATNLQTFPVTIFGLQHNAGNYADTSSAHAAAMSALQHEWVSTGEPFSFTWKNVEKFGWKEPLGDQSTSTSTQTWCQNVLSSKYGGFIAAYSPFITGTVSSTVLGTSVPLGVCVMKYKVSMRARA
jgi:hypothetical protein